jgi:hypothetical protein
MGGEPIPEDVQAFIWRHIESIAQLEALLLLRREPNVAWSPYAAGRRLYISADSCAALLAKLCADGFLAEQNGAFKYKPGTSEQDDLVGRLAEFYAHQLIPVTNLIHARSARIRQFADAFKIRKDN